MSWRPRGRAWSQDLHAHTEKPSARASQKPPHPSPPSWAVHPPPVCARTCARHGHSGRGVPTSAFDVLAGALLSLTPLILQRSGFAFSSFRDQSVFTSHKDAESHRAPLRAPCMLPSPDPHCQAQVCGPWEQPGRRCICSRGVGPGGAQVGARSHTLQRGGRQRGSRPPRAAGEGWPSSPSS